METAATTKVTVGTTIKAPVERVWQYWTEPRHITQWNKASDDWHCPRAENEVRVSGRFISRMEARDGSMGFDFTGTYTSIKEYEMISYALDDERKVQVLFSPNGNETSVTETFEVEQTYQAEMQRAGWQAILDSFKSYAEAAGKLESLHFEIHIHAKAGKVYQTMLDEKHYAVWTAEFNPTSHYSGSWEKGTKILFLGEDKDGNTEGMVSRIRENVPSHFVSIEHLGLVSNGTEVTSGAAVEGWAGAMENYTFTEENGITLLSVDMDANQEHKAYFTETWPKALQKLKAICEA